MSFTVSLSPLLHVFIAFIIIHKKQEFYCPTASTNKKEKYTAAGPQTVRSVFELLVQTQGCRAVITQHVEVREGAGKLCSRWTAVIKSWTVTT